VSPDVKIALYTRIRGNTDSICENLRHLRNLRSDFRRYRCLPVVLLVLRKTPIAATAGAKTNAIRAGPDTFSS
jgi:hypothetical protein